MKDKKQIRSEIMQTLATMSAEASAKASQAACKQLIGQREFADAGTVMIFLPMPGEIDARRIARDAWAAGKRVAVPKVAAGAQGLMEAIEIHSLEADLAVNRWGIHEPTSNRPLGTNELDLIVVPGLAYDQYGNRLGRGGGYYDRFIKRAPDGIRLCGLAFARQLLDELPTNPYDQPVHMLATETDFLRFRR
ncbi:MAG: 5-formyltetrahydrofolate cyclo-ligase [Phycisphaerae bacterium]|nr:5-formyltetrahydrofolate cyclo-ligase [Phycisphaerae bacterium]